MLIFTTCIYYPYITHACAHAHTFQDSYGEKSIENILQTLAGIEEKRENFTFYFLFWVALICTSSIYYLHNYKKKDIKMLNI